MDWHTGIFFLTLASGICVLTLASLDRHLCSDTGLYTAYHDDLAWPPWIGILASWHPIFVCPLTGIIAGHFFGKFCKNSPMTKFVFVHFWEIVLEVFGACKHFK